MRHGKHKERMKEITWEMLYYYFYPALHLLFSHQNPDKHTK